MNLHVYIINKLSCSFEFNLELIFTCQFFKKLNVHSPKQLVQKSLMQINLKLNLKPYNLPILFQKSFQWLDKNQRKFFFLETSKKLSASELNVTSKCTDSLSVKR